MPKFRNKSVHDLDVALPSGIRRVNSGDVLEVSDDEAEGIAVQVDTPGSFWEPVGSPAKAAVKHAHDDEKDD